MVIGDRIRKLREEKGYTTTQLARKTGLRQSAISGIENNCFNPSLKTLEKICRALGITLGEFFASEVQELPPEIRRLVNSARAFTPTQLRALDAFLATLKPQLKEDLDSLLPRNERDLGQAILKIQEIAHERGLTQSGSETKPEPANP